LNIKNVNVLILFIGVFASLAYIFMTVSTVGAIILAFYAIQIVIALKIYYPSPWGIVFNSRSQLLVKGAITRLYKDNDNRIIDIDITDESGKFSFRAKEGNYFFKISHPDYVLDKYSESSLLEISNMEEGLVSIERHNNQASYMHVPLTK
ncbi:hypothetical protein KC909_06475, partial [Candidatus Dojkabacteria bacterium]|nr:hypothetical protein [Candidatus Dojkabacteria bacterium]